MKEDNFVLSEKWCIYLDKENIQELTKFYFSHINEYEGCSSYAIKVGDTFHYPQHTKNAHSWGGNNIQKGYSSITFNQFKRYVLKEIDMDDNGEMEEDLDYLIILFKELKIE